MPHPIRPGSGDGAKIMATFTGVDKSAQPVELTPDQVLAATEFYAEYGADIERGSTANKFVEYYLSDKTSRRDNRADGGREQIFGVFGTTAYQLFTGEFDDDGVKVTWCPLLIDGNLVHESPEEGQSGTAHLLFIENPNRKYRPKWFVSFLQCGWIRTSELEQSNAGILENIADEIDRGETPLTGGGLPGWA